MKTYNVKTQVSFPFIPFTVTRESQYTIGQGKEPPTDPKPKTLAPLPFKITLESRTPPSTPIVKISKPTENYSLWTDDNPAWWEFTSTFDCFKREMKRYPILTKEEVYHLIELAQYGDLAARNVIVLHNQKLVLKIVNRYKTSNFFETMDLVQEGMFGLFKAIEKFDRALKGEFSTYAFWWINQTISRAIQDQKSTVRLPVHMQDYLSSIRKKIVYLTQKLQREATFDDVIFWYPELEVPQTNIVKEFLNLSYLSLDYTVKKDEDNKEMNSCLGDIITEPSLSAFNRLVGKDILKNQSFEIQRLVALVENSELKPNYKKVFFMYHGLNGEKEIKTLELIGQQFGVTRERIRQMISKVWETLGESTKITHKSIDSIISDLRDTEDATGLKVELTGVNIPKYFLTLSPAQTMKVVTHIMKIIADFYGISEEMLYAETLKEKAKEIHQIGIYILKRNFKLSFSQLARKLGYQEERMANDGYTQTLTKLRKNKLFAVELKKIEELCGTSVLKIL